MTVDSAYVQQIDASSSYFFKIDSPLLQNSYGENQERYREFSRQVAEDFKKEIQFAINFGNSNQILSSNLSKFGRLRKNIAKEIGTLDAEVFGLLRSEISDKSYLCATILSGSLYNAAANRLINSIIQSLLQILPRSFSSFEEMFDLMSSGVKYLAGQTQSDNCLSYCSMVLRRQSDLENISNSLFHNDSISTIPNGNMLHIVFPDRSVSGELIALDPQKWIRFLGAVDHYNMKIPSQEDTTSLFLHGEITLKQQPESLILSDFILRFDMDISTNCVTEICPPLILHMNRRWMKTMIQNIDLDIETLLKLSNLAPIENIIDLIGAIRYKFAHAIPFIRGSAAIGEWIETALYRYMGFNNFHQSSATTIDLEAFSSLSFQEFLMRYRSIIGELNLIRTHPAGLLDEDD